MKHRTHRARPNVAGWLCGVGIAISRQSSARRKTALAMRSAGVGEEWPMVLDDLVARGYRCYVGME